MIERKESYITIQQNKRLKVIFLTLFFVFVFLLGYIFRYYFWPFLFALILYIGLKPIYDFLLKRVRSKVLCSALMIVVLFLAVLIPLFFLLFSLSNQTYDFYIFIQQKLNPGVIEGFLHKNAVLKPLYRFFQITEGEVILKFREALQKVSLSAFTNLADMLTFSLRFVVNFFFMILILFFLFSEGNKFRDVVGRALPFPVDIEQDVINRLKEVIRILLAGNLLIMGMQGLMLGIGFAIGGIGSSLLWGSVAAVFSLIPVIGTMVVWVPAVVYLVIVGKIGAAVFIGLWCLIAYLVLENFVKPIVFGEKLDFHPLVFFFLLLGSLQAFGLPGILVGPLLLTLFISFWEIYKILQDYDLRRVNSENGSAESKGAENQVK